MDEVRQLAALLLLRARSAEGILDLLLVWFFVFECLRLVKGSHAHHLKGLGITLAGLAAAWLLTRPEGGLLKLDTFNWLLTNLAPFALLALVVVFQPELRQSVGQLGQVSLFGRAVGGPNRLLVVACVNEVVEAACELSVRKIGALIAMERRENLSDITVTGKELDAEVSAEMLMTVFFPNTPLHDGAVVVRRGRIAAAACLLPLSLRQDLASSLGTRHRAAIGLSERSDAVVVVVSEETGTISLVYDGEMFRGLREEDLKGRLLELLQPAGSSLLSSSERGGTDEGAET